MYNPNYYYPPVSPMHYAGGGDVRSSAQDLASKGRYGDNMLVHMNPQEVAGLASLARAHGGQITINPHTGLPEAWGIGDIFGSKGIVGKAAGAIGLGDVYSDVSKGVSGALQGITKALAPYASILGAIPGVGIPLAAIIGGMRDGKHWDPKRGVMSAIGAYGVNSMMYPGASAAAAPISNAADSAGILNAGAGTSTAAGAGATITPELLSGTSTAVAPNISAGATQIPATSSAPLEFGDRLAMPGGSYVQTAPVSGTAFTPTADYSGIRGLDTAGERILSGAGSLTSSAGEAAIDMALRNPKTALTAAYMGYTGLQAKKEMNRAKEEAARILADQQAHTAQQIAWAKQVMAESPSRYDRLSEADVRKYGIGMAAGGIADTFDDEVGRDYARGGIASLPPRYLSGGGDGMSDSIPARIGGRQEARLADGEFVVPADVVSHLGNGSSNAGAKKLYAMMDRVRQARTGKTKQAPAVNMKRILPA